MFHGNSNECRWMLRLFFNWNNTVPTFESQDMPSGASKVLLTLIAPLELQASSKSNPIATSDALSLNPNSARSHPGLAPLIHALMIELAPKVLIVPQTRPADPLSPSTRVSAIVDPMRVVNAPISMRLFPKFMDWKVKPLAMVLVEESLAIMLGNSKKRLRVTCGDASGLGTPCKGKAQQKAS